MYVVYIMASRSRTLYIGVTSDLHLRAWQHKNHTFEGFTSRYKIDRLVYYETCYEIGNAIEREKQLKRWSRGKKLRLIEQMNPTWSDLSEGWYHPATVPDRKNRNADPSTPFARKKGCGRSG